MTADPYALVQGVVKQRIDGLSKLVPKVHIYVPDPSVWDMALAPPVDGRSPIGSLLTSGESWA